MPLTTCIHRARTRGGCRHGQSRLSRRRRRQKPVCDNCLEIYQGDAIGFEIERGFQVGLGSKEFVTENDRLWCALLTKRSLGSFRPVADVRGG